METSKDNIAIPDELLRRYSEFRSLGSGAMGAVYRAHDSNLDIDVAIKLLKMRQIAPEIAVRFQQEAKVASKLKHHNLVTMLDFGISEKGEPYIIMESVAGNSLADELKKRGALSISEAFNIMVQICDGMEHAHRSGVIHRDLKPSNVMVCGDDLHNATIKVLDFGIAKLNDTNGSITRTGTVLGTPYYMSPEQFSGESVDQRTDIYAAGTMLFRLLTNNHPFEGETLLEMMQEKQNYEAPLITESPGGEDIPPEVEEVVARAIARDPDERYESMKEFQEAMLLALDKIHIKLEQQPQQIQEKQKLFTPEALRLYAKVGAFLILVTAVTVMLFSMNVFTKRVEVIGVEKPIRKTSNPIADKVFSERDNKLTAEGLVYDQDLEWIADNATNLGGLILSEADSTEIQNQISKKGYAAIGKMPLEELILINCSMKNSDVKLVLKNPKLKKLDLSRTGVGDPGIAYLANSKVESLWLRGIPITDKCIDSLQRMPNLHHLSLEGTPITDVGYEKLSKLKKIDWLNITATDGTADGLKYIGELPRLKTLYIGGAEFGTKGIENLSKLKLEYLNVEGDQSFNDQSLQAVLKYWPNIVNLHIDNTSITGSGLKVLSKFKRLSTLSLNSNNLSDNDLLPVLQMPKLTTLFLMLNKITDKSVERLAKMPTLHYVDLTHCDVTTAGLAQLKKIKQEEITIKDAKNDGKDTAQQVMTELLENGDTF